MCTKVFVKPRSKAVLGKLESALSSLLADLFITYVLQLFDFR